MMGYGGYGGYSGGSNEGQAQMQGAGGFNANPFNTNQNQATPGTGGSQQKARAAQSLRPVSVKQIIESTTLFQDSPLTVDGKELTQVVLVGRVNVTATAIVYTIDDGSGVIDVKKFMEHTEDDQMQEEPTVQDGGYVKVIGRVKVFNSKKSVDAHKIMSVRSVDEVCHHILSITFTHLSITKPKPTARPANAGDGTSFTGAAFGVADTMAGDFSSLQKQIMSLIQQYSHATEGADIHDVVFALRASATEAQIRAEIGQMMNDGYLFCTTDDDHFKLTGSG